jgi:hypothetical protein
MQPWVYPKGLVGPEWLLSQGARTETQRMQHGHGRNPELTDPLALLGMRTAVEIDVSGAESWQVAYGDSRRETLQSAAVDPARMVQYVAGRPCVACYGEQFF